MSRKVKDWNSTTNQDIKGRFVGREVYCCQTHEMNYILAKSWEDKDAPYSWDDIENNYNWVCPECGDSMDEYEHDGADSHNFVCVSCNHKQDDEPEQEPQEIFEWWAVSCYLARRLKEQGQPVIECGYGVSYWGRCCTGQAILLDEVISRICDDMEILDGQANSWAKSK